MSGIEDDLVLWAKKLGYRPTDASLSKVNMAKLCRGNRAFWEFAMKNFHSVDDLQALRGGLVQEARRDEEKAARRDAGLAAKRRATIPRIEETNAALRKMRDLHMKRYQEKVEESVKLEAKAVAAQQGKEDSELQLLTLRLYRQRWEALLPILVEKVEGVAAARSWARARAQSAASPSLSQGSDLPAQFAHLTAKMQAELEQRVQQLWGVQLTGAAPVCSAAGAEASTEGGAGLAGDVKGPLAAMPLSEEVLRQVQGSLMHRPPQHILAALMQLTREAVQHLACLSSCEVNAGDADGGEPAPDPLQLLKERQKAHLDRFITAQHEHNTSAEAALALQALVPDPRVEALLRRSLNKAQVQASGQRARLSALSAELHRLHAACSSKVDVQRDMQCSFEAIGQQCHLLELMAALILQLSNEGSALMQGWEAEEEHWGVAVNSYLPSICEATTRSSAQAHDGVAGELAAWQCVPLLKLGAGQLAPQHRGSGLPHQQPLVLLCSQALTLVPSLEVPGKQPTPTSSWAAAAEQRLPLVLRGAADLDAVAPLRCPSSLLDIITGQQLQLQDLLTWLADSEGALQGPAAHLEWHYGQYRATRRALDAVRHEDLHDRLPRAQQTLDRLQQLRQHYEGPFQHTTAACQELPAVQLLPEVKVEGFSAAEWLLAIRDSHAMLRMAREEAREL